MNSKVIDLALLILRVSFGLQLALLHGWGKFLKLIGGDHGFADPLGIGSFYSLLGAVTTEFICGLLLAAGLFTRPAAAGVSFTMLVAGFVVHGADPWKRRELAVLYLTAALTLLLTGAGRYSLGHVLRPTLARVFGAGVLGRRLSGAA